MASSWRKFVRLSRVQRVLLLQASLALPLIYIALRSAGLKSLCAALTRLAPNDRPIPEIVQSGIIDFLRPVLGAASAVALVLVIESGIQSAIDPDGLQIYVWAVLAGFSELLLRRTLNSVSASAQTATSPTTPPDTDDSNGDAT